MKAAWPIRHLSEVCTKISDGTHHSPRTQHLDAAPGRFKYITSKNIRSSGLDLSEVTYVDEDVHAEIFARCDPQYGDVLLTKDGVNTGTVAVNTLKEEFSLLSSVAILRPDTTCLDASYLKYYLESPAGSSHLTGKMTGTAIRRVILRNIKETRIPIAPLDEQRRIVSEIEKQFTRLEKASAALEATDRRLSRYRASVSYSTFAGRLAGYKKSTARKTTLGELLLRIEAGRSFRCDERPPQAKEVGVAKVSAVSWGEYDEAESKTCQDVSRVNEQFLIRSGDFLFSRANTIALVGACVIARRVSHPVMLSDKILRFTLRQDVSSAWVLHWLRSEFGRHEIERLSTGNQDSMRNIGQDRIRQIRIEIPPLSEQIRIVGEIERHLGAAADMATAVETNLRRAKTLRQSILQKAFSGQL